jgi:SAM-dependent methyltransferase
MDATDWAGLWRELVERDAPPDAAGEAELVERWRRMAARLDAGAAEPDALLAHILDRLSPAMSVLDVGAGIGRWSLPLARRARAVTAVEPLPGMREILADRIAQSGLANVALAAAPWMEAEVPPHDVVIAAHAVYATPDLAAFVRRLEAHARRSVYLALRVPARDGIIGELSHLIHGRWHDSPNFIVGYNLLLEAGFTPNVLVEPRRSRRWIDPTLEAALARARRHLQLADSAHDETIRRVLARRLREADGGYLWPDGMRSALIWWDLP